MKQKKKWYIKRYKKKVRKNATFGYCYKKHVCLEG